MLKNNILRYDEHISFQLRALYGQHGYIPYRMSKFEEYDLYVRNKRFLVSEHILTFTDTDGRLMALKPDVTLSIVKNTPDDGVGLHKVCYNESVYRTSPASIGYQEITQTGIECIGQLDLFAMAEVISLAYGSLALIGSDFLLDLSHMGFIRSLLEPLDEATQTELLEALSQKNTGAIRQCCAAKGVDPQLCEQLALLAGLYGPPSAVLPLLEPLASTADGKATLEELRQLCALLSAMNCEDKLRLDFSIVNDMHYYNSVIFRGYLPGLASGVLAGGRYDNLLQRMGKAGGAIGFAVYLDQLERLDTGENDYDVDVLLLYDDTTDPSAVAARLAALTSDGSRVRAERTIPPTLRCRRQEDLRKGGGR